MRPLTGQKETLVVRKNVRETIETRRKYGLYWSLKYWIPQKGARKKDSRIAVQGGRVHTGIDNREKQPQEGAVYDLRDIGFKCRVSWIGVTHSLFYRLNLIKLRGLCSRWKVRRTAIPD